MIKVRVKLVGPFKGPSGRGEIMVTLNDDASIKSLFQNPKETMGVEFKRDPDDLGLDGLRQTALILVNDVEIGLLQEIDTKLKNHDIVTVIPVTHGG